ncbi:MAG: ParB N-terminal domain-containing protein [Amaricoccus sp.]
MPDPLQLIPLAEIDAEALTRDRTRRDQAALTELALSIATHGLRMPIEVFELADPEPPVRYGLVSGFRRLAAVRSLAETARDKSRFAAIPAFVRPLASADEAYVQMVEENAIRSGISPWEQAMVALNAARAGAFPGIDAAIDALYASLGRQKRARIRAAATVAEELAGHLAFPEHLSERQLLRLAPLIPRGLGDLLRAILADTDPDAPEDEWRALLPAILEAERPEPPETIHRPGRPRRVLRLRPQGLTIRRELTRTGWCLHFAGRDATSPLLDAVLDEIERLFLPPEPTEPGKHKLPPRRT